MPSSDFIALPEEPVEESGESSEDKRRDGRLPKLSLLLKDQSIGKDEGAIHATAGLIEKPCWILAFPRGWWAIGLAPR